MTAYRAAVVGCGRIGCAFDDDPRRGYVSTHAGAYAATDGFDLVALCDVDVDRLARYGEKFRARGRYTSVDDLLAKQDVDVLSICTTVDTHSSITARAAEAGVRAVFCEKPIAGTLADADEMVRISDERGMMLFVGHQRRFDRFHREAAAYVREGGFGPVQQATAYYTAGLANTGTHLVDLLRLLIGEAAWVMGTLSAAPSGNPADPNVDGWIGFDGGAVAALQATDVQAYTIFEVNLLGTAGRLRVGDHGFSATYEQAVDSPRFAGYQQLVPAAVPIDDSGPREYMLQAMAHVRDCLDGNAIPWSSGRDGRQALEILVALRWSADQGGRRVDLPLPASLRDAPYLQGSK
jgi:predicted dehydrogenase